MARTCGPKVRAEWDKDCRAAGVYHRFHSEWDELCRLNPDKSKWVLYDQLFNAWHEDPEVMKPILAARELIRSRLPKLPPEPPPVVRSPSDRLEQRPDPSRFKCANASKVSEARWVSSVCGRDPKTIKPEDSPSEAAWNLLRAVIDKPDDWFRKEYASLKDSSVGGQDMAADILEAEEAARILKGFLREVSCST